MAEPPRNMPSGGAERRIWFALASFIVAVVVVGIFSVLPGGDPGERLPVVSTIPDFELIDSSGKPVSRSDFDGEVWVADFIFTNCAGICPVLSARMGEVQKALGEREIDARLVSISVDPARDTPDALKAYARRFSAEPDRWWFLTGERDALYDLIGKGFLVSVADRTQQAADADGGELITHSDRFVLVDRQARIRGYYHGSDREAVATLIDDIEELASSE